MKKVIITVLCVLTVMMIAGCKGNEGEEVITPGVQIANPFTDEDSLLAVQDKAGFQLTLPENFNGCVSYLYRAMADKMIEIICLDGEGNETARIRKAVGSDSISGDYNEYADIKEDGSLIIKGNDGKYSVAEWTEGNYSYAITVETPVSLETMKELKALIK